MRWIALFSQTGSEIANLAHTLGKAPHMIITNNRKMETWNPGVGETHSILMRGTHSDIVDYLNMIEPAIITLHGYLRILPESVCKRHTIYNGHPGDIITYPALKGKDPQKKAIELGLPSTGVVLHKVIPAVDDGPVQARETIKITDQTEEELIYDLKEIQLRLWTNFLKGKV